MPGYITREELYPLLRQVDTTVGKKGETHAECPWCGANSSHFNLYEKGFACVKCGNKGKYSILADHLGYRKEEEKRETETQECVYRYTDGAGELVFEVVRYKVEGGKRKKRFRQRRPDPNDPSRHIWNLEGLSPRPLYQLPLIRETMGEPVFVVEGEKDVETLLAKEFTATTSSMGAGNAKYTDWTSLNGKVVHIIPDNDESGKKYCDEVASLLVGKVGDLTILDLPEGVKDITEWFEAGNKVEDFHALIMTAHDWVRPAGALADRQTRFTYNELLKGEAPPVTWLIENILPESGIGLLSGDGGIGKTWLMMHIAQAVAGGAQVFHNFPVKQGPVLYWDEESTDIMVRDRIQRLHAPMPMLTDNLPIIWHIGEGWKINDEECFAKLKAEIKEVKPALVCIDSLIAIHDCDENSAVDIRQRVFGPLVRLRHEFGCGFLIAHHTRKPTQIQSSNNHMVRGSSDIVNVLDCHLYCRKYGEEIIIEHAKARFSFAVPTFCISFEGHETMQLVYKCGDQDVVGLEQAKSRVIEYLLEIENTPIPRTKLAEAVASEGTQGRTIQKAITTLFEEGKLVREKEGRNAMYSLDLSVM